LLAGLVACSPQPDLGPRARVGLMSALPLFWHENTDPAAMISGEDQRAPLVKAMAARHDVSPVDVLHDKALKGLDILLLAQPRLLQGEELVALDDWVRSGGHVLIFADPDLVWPSSLEMGDNRRAPVISLLDPLYRHWGLALDGPTGGESPARAEIADKQVAVVAAGQWRSGAQCRVESQGLVADCALGRGRAILVADADLLDARLWTEMGVDGGAAILALVARFGESNGVGETGREH
jgi:hypothetical protein